jgi:hypothetical protein
MPMLLHVETAKHVILCPEEGHVEVFMRLSELLEWWLYNVNRDPELAECTVEYVQGRGQELMEEIVWGSPERFNAMGRSQDKIGWQQFLEGMVSKEITRIQQQHYALSGSRMSLERWSSRLITRLLEITDGPWVYRNFSVHDPVSGTIATAKKEELLREIERQRELGDAGLLEEDKYELALRVRAYPQILSKYLSVRSSVACVPIQIILGTVFRLIICSVVCETA